MRVADRWDGMYRLTLTPVAQGDFEMANWFTATHPKTRFVRNLVAARVIGASRFNLLNATLSIHGSGGVQHRLLASPEELYDVLTNRIGLELPASAEEIWNRLPAEPYRCGREPAKGASKRRTAAPRKKTQSGQRNRQQQRTGGFRRIDRADLQNEAVGISTTSPGIGVDARYYAGRGKACVAEGGRAR